MSIVVETFIYCDGENCPTDGEPLDFVGHRRMNAREQLRGSGWLAKGGQHFCPVCRKALLPKRRKT